MRNLIIDAANYTSINGKRYGVGEYGCNYPTNDAVWNGDITLSSSTNIITTTGDFYQLLGGSIENSNVPLYRWLIAENVIIEIAYLISSTEAVLTCATNYDGVLPFVAVDYFGQPTVSETLAIDSTAGTYAVFVLNTVYGTSTLTAGGGVTVSLGAAPILVHFAGGFATLALNIQYTS